MSELTIGQIVKGIVAAVLIAVIIGGLAMAFIYYVVPYFKGLSFKKTAEIVLVLVNCFA